MAKNQVEKLIDEAIDTKGTYAEFIVSPGNLAFICDGGLRRSTRNYKVDDKAIIVIERALKRINERSILFTGSLRRIMVIFATLPESGLQRRIKRSIVGHDLHRNQMRDVAWHSK